MQQVKVYKTNDGTLFDNRTKAENHELMLTIRGIIQTHVKGTSFTPTELATIMVKEQDRVFNTLGKYRRTMAALKSIPRIGN